jgi:hypothetical protein
MAGLVGAIIGGAFAMIVLLLEELVMPRRICPQCQKKIRRFRGIARWWHFLIERRTCPECGCVTNHKRMVIQDCNHASNATKSTHY